MSSAAEIHRYPLKPLGVEEPLWMTPEWRRRVLDHLCRSDWLCRASELPVRRGTSQAAHTRDEPVYVLKRENGTSIIRLARPARPSWRKRPVVEVVDLWREVRAWWNDEEAVDRLVVRTMLGGGAVVDLARYGVEDWSLVGIVD